MNNAIRHTWVVSVTMFVTLFAALSIIQVALTEDLNSDPNNTRQIYNDRGAPRGAITVDGSPIAESVPAENSNFDYQRVYHDPELYFGITGFFPIAAHPTGLENELNEYLSGHSDSQFFDRMTSMFTGETMEGAQVELTLDPELQRQAYDLIPEGQRGSIVVQEVDTGDIVSLASRPSYDTNDLATHSTEEYNANIAELEDSEHVSPYYFRPINSTIAPGSVFKLVDLAAMLESGDYDPDTVLENPSELDLPDSDRTLPNFTTGLCHQQTESDLTWIVAQSCNTPFGEAAMDMGEEPLRDTAEDFGWNQELNIPLSTSASAFPETTSQADLAYSSIGQGSVTATPLQINMVSQGVANGGTVMHPNLVDSIRGPDLQLLEQPEPQVLGEATSEEVAGEMTEMMEAVVDEGTGQSAQSQSFDVAAKTGTAETGNEGQVHTWITGFAPADDPQYAVTVVYENIDYETGHSMTGPQMRQMLEAVIEP